LAKVMDFFRKKIGRIENFGTILLHLQCTRKR